MYLPRMDLLRRIFFRKFLTNRANPFASLLAYWPLCWWWLLLLVSVMMMHLIYATTYKNIFPYLFSFSCLLLMFVVVIICSYLFCDSLLLFVVIPCFCCQRKIVHLNNLLKHDAHIQSEHRAKRTDAHVHNKQRQQKQITLVVFFLFEWLLLLLILFCFIYTFSLFDVSFELVSFCCFRFQFV